MNDLKEIDKTLPQQVKFDNIVKNIIEQHKEDKEVNVLAIIVDEVEHYEVDFEEFVTYITSKSSIKTLFGEMLAEQGFDRGSQHKNLFQKKITSLF